MLTGFHSFHWHGCDLGDEALTRAVAELMNPDDKTGYLGAFRTLLHSGNTVAAGIAFDHFNYSGALTRFGGTRATDTYEQEVLTVARHMLRQPPVTEPFAGANHASALHAMMNIAEAVDADLIADTLDGATDPNVRGAAATAAMSALEDTRSPRLVAALETAIFDEDLEVRDRSDLLSAVHYAHGPEATALLVRATESAEIPLQIEGAIGLVTPDRLPAHRERVERLAASWPEDVSYRADDVREALDPKVSQ